MKLVKGATGKITSKVYLDEEEKVLANITGASIRAMFKANYNDPDSAALLTKNIGSGVTITNGAGGICETVITAAESLAWTQSEIYFELLVKQTDNSYIRNGVDKIKLFPNVQKELN